MNEILDVLQWKIIDKQITEKQLKFVNDFITSQNLILKQRTYHNLKHVEYMIENYNKYARRFCDDTTHISMILAIYFHDLVYHPWSNKNEELSVDLFLHFANQLNILSDKIINKTCELILETTHKPVSMNIITNNYHISIENAIIRDLDLLSFSTLNHDVDIRNFDMKIYMEFQPYISKEIYYKNRLSFIDYLSRLDVIYYSDIFSPLNTKTKEVLKSYTEYLKEEYILICKN